jgi:hypothetical protein
MEKYIEIIKLLEKIFGKGSVGRSIGTRTNVVRLPQKEGIDSTTKNYDMNRNLTERPQGYQDIKKDIKDRMGELTQMNDSQLLIYKDNLKKIDMVENPPMADVVKADSGEQVSGQGLEDLIKKSGQKNPPGSLLGNIESRLNKIKATTEEMKEISGKETVGDFLNDYFNLQKTTGRGRSLEDQAYVRAAVRQIMYTDFNAGKLKFSKELEEMATGKTNKDPIEVFRKLYGEDALEHIDDILPQIKTLTKNMEAEELARSKFNFEPKPDRPKGSYTDEEMQTITDKVSKNLDPNQLIEEYNSNYKLLSQVDEEGGTLLGYEKFNKLQNRNTEIERMLDSMGVKPAPKVKSKKDEVKSAEDMIEEDDFDPSGMAKGGRIGFGQGKRVLTEIDKLIEKLNKKKLGDKITTADKIKRPESALRKEMFDDFNKRNKKIDEPTGVTTMDPEPDIIDERKPPKINKGSVNKKIDKSKQLPKKGEFMEDGETPDYDYYKELLDDSENSRDFNVEGNETIEVLEDRLKQLKDEEAYYYGQYKMGKLDPEPGEINRSRLYLLRQRAEDAEMTRDFRLFGEDELDELDSLEKRFEYLDLEDKAQNISKKMTGEEIQKLKEINDSGYVDFQKEIDKINRNKKAKGGIARIRGLLK